MSEPTATSKQIDRSRMTVSDEIAVEIVGMNKWFGTFHVLRDIDLTVYKGERIVIAGPSGAGEINAHPLHQRFGGASAGQHCG